jgi:hypothetical protein
VPRLTLGCKVAPACCVLSASAGARGRVPLPTAQLAANTGAVRAAVTMCGAAVTPGAPASGLRAVARGQPGRAVCAGAGGHLMTACIQRRAPRTRKRERVGFIDPASTIPGTDISVQDARNGGFSGGAILAGLRRQRIQGTSPCSRPNAGRRNMAYVLRKATKFSEAGEATGVAKAGKLSAGLFARLLAEGYAKLRAVGNRDVHDDSRNTTQPVGRNRRDLRRRSLSRRRGTSICSSSTSTTKTWRRLGSGSASTWMHSAGAAPASHRTWISRSREALRCRSGRSQL